MSRSPSSVKSAVSFEPCGCPTLPWGGFERRATHHEAARSEPRPGLSHRRGGHLVKGFATQRADKLEERASEVLRLSEMVGVDLWVVGASDLMAFPASEPGHGRRTDPHQRDLADSHGSAAAGPEHRPRARRTSSRGHRSERGPSTDSGLTQRDPVEAARSALAGLPDDLDWIVAVSNLDEDDAAKVADEVQGLSVILSTRGSEYDSPEA